jgi:hypothetical protein
MVNSEGKHSEKTQARQGFPPDSPGPYKIAASTPFDFGAKKPYSLRRLVSRGNDVGEVGLQKTG